MGEVCFPSLVLLETYGLTSWFSHRYAYGCNELVFNPMVKWFVRGPFTKLFLTFLWSSPIPLSSKINILGYICSCEFLCLAKDGNDPF
jgi:hypothetical protein